MSEYLINGVVLAFIVYGIWFTFQEGEIFGFVTKYGKEYIPKAIQPSLFACPVCMVPWWGLALFPIWFNFYIVSWATMLAIGLGVNAVIVGLKPKEKTPENVISPEVVQYIENLAKGFGKYYIEKMKHDYNPITALNIEERSVDMQEDIDHLYSQYIKSFQNE